MRTSFQSTSSSSAMIIGSIVFMPCPISGFLAMIVTMPSGAILMNEFGRQQAVAASRRGACAKHLGDIEVAGDQHAAAGEGGHPQEGAAIRAICFHDASFTAVGRADGLRG